MSSEMFSNSMLDASDLGIPLPQEKPTIRILLYTDDPQSITKDDELLGLSTMIEHLKAHAPTFANLSIEWLSRNSSKANHADVKLSAELLEKFDEIWFFGVHQVNRKNFNIGILRGGPQSELGKEEVLALSNWMRVGGETGLDGGGVLMTGDHANLRPPDAVSNEDAACPDNSEHEEFLGLGRALGHCVPRAGLMRKWEGKPTAFKENSFNTQSPITGIKSDSLRLQVDPIPQQLILQTFDEKGNPVSGGQVHPLFFYKDGQAIQVFPDHAHEGAIIEPSNLEDTEIWPKNHLEVQPQPHVLARGIDKRNFQVLNLVSAYDGDCANVGRVIADSTWHHYVNVNLHKFRPPAREGSDGDQIGQFYANLAIWLSPRSIRRKMAEKMTEWLANFPLMLEEVGGDPLEIGQKAYLILSKVASPCEIHELLLMLVPDNIRARFETIYFPEKGFILSAFPSKEVLLGSVISLYYQQSIEEESLSLKPGPLTAAVAAQQSGFEMAMKKHVGQIAMIKSDAENL